MVELRVVEAVQQVDRARPRGGEADADLARPLRVRARHERGHLLVPGLDELDPVTEAFERADDRVDPVARVAIDPAYPVLVQALEEEFRGGLSHGVLSADRVPMHHLPRAPAANRRQRT